MLGLIRQALIVISGKLGQAKFDSLFRLVYLLFLRATQGLKLVSRSSKKNTTRLPTHTYSQPQSRTTLPNRIQPTLSQKFLTGKSGHT